MKGSRIILDGRGSPYKPDCTHPKPLQEHHVTSRREEGTITGKVVVSYLYCRSCMRRHNQSEKRV